jgi:TOBE domain
MSTVMLLVGQSVSLVLRPESVALLSHRGAAPAEQVAAPGVVRTRTFLGEKVEYAVEVAGVLLRAVSYDLLHHGLFDVGARVQVSCAPASLRVLG